MGVAFQATAVCSIQPVARAYLAVAKGRCYGNQLNLGGDVRKLLQERYLLVALAFDNGLASHEATSKGLNGNNPATSCTHLVNFRPIISEITL